jgi:hypothetical protein
MQTSGDRFLTGLAENSRMISTRGKSRRQRLRWLRHLMRMPSLSKGMLSMQRIDHTWRTSVTPQVIRM